MTTGDEQQKNNGGEQQNEVYVYGGENGIKEKHGAIPPWLILVAVGLIAWGVWYTITYWSAPA